MINKYKTLGASIALITLGSVQAAVVTNVNLTGGDLNPNDVTSGFDDTSMTGAFNVTKTVDLDGDGTADTLTLSFSATTTGGNTNEDPFSTWFIVGSDVGMSPGESISIAYTGATVAFTDPTYSLGSVAFAGFTSVNTINAWSTGGEVEINGTTYTEGVDSVPISFAASPTIDFSVTSGFARWNGANGAFTVTAVVPEPSSALLLGMGGLALVARRKK